MHPLLFTIGSVPIHTYGFLIAIGFLCGVWLGKWLAACDHQDINLIVDLSFWCLFTGFLGARILYIITTWQEYAADPWSVLKIWQGGLVFYGGPLAALPAGIWFIRKHKMDLWKTCDIIVPGFVLNHMFGRFGCFSAGCCYGKPTSAPWGVKFYSDLVDPQFRGIPLHPTQLYEAFSIMILVSGLVWIHRHRKFDGQVTLTYFMAYPIIRSIIEIYRGDHIRGFVIEDILSTSQFISILVFLAAAIATLYRLRQVKQAA